MDVAILGKEITAFLAPFLPDLVKMGGVAAGEASKELSADALESAKALWGKLRPKVEAKPAAQEAVNDVVAAPKDEDAQASLRACQQMARASALVSALGCGPPRWR